MGCMLVLKHSWLLAGALQAKASDMIYIRRALKDRQSAFVCYYNLTLVFDLIEVYLNPKSM